MASACGSRRPRSPGRLPTASRADCTPRQIRSDRGRERAAGAVRIRGVDARRLEFGEHPRRRTAGRRSRRPLAWPPLITTAGSPSRESLEPPHAPRLDRGSAPRSALRPPECSASRSARAAAVPAAWRRIASSSSRRSPLLATITGSTTRCGSSSSSIAAATASTIAALASMPVFVAWIAMSPATASICAVTRSARERQPLDDADGVLGGDGRDRARAVDAERRKGLQIGLDARAAARVAARDRQRRRDRAGHRPRRFVRRAATRCRTRAETGTAGSTSARLQLEAGGLGRANHRIRD